MGIYFYIYFIKKNKMGGIPTHPVDCSHYMTADGVDRDMENYIIHGVLVEAPEMLYYGWLDWGMYVWYMNTMSYTDTMTQILDCAISNEVEGSKFGNEEFYKNTWTLVMMEMQPIYDTLHIFWFPALYYLIAYFLSAGVGAIVLLVINIIYMLRFSDNTVMVFQEALRAAD